MLIFLVEISAMCVLFVVFKINNHPTCFSPGEGGDLDHKCWNCVVQGINCTRDIVPRVSFIDDLDGRDTDIFAQRKGPKPGSALFIAKSRPLQ